MSDDILKPLLNPRSVALVGASGTAGRVTARPLAFLEQHGFEGAIYPINPGRNEIGSHRAYPSLDALPETPDHVYVLLDADAALDVVREAIARDVRVISILADGFAEAGPEGAARQQRLIEIANGSDTLIVGPNSMGVVDTRARFACTTNAAFSADALPPGRFAVISQSGSVIGTIFSRGAAVGLGASTFVSVGNEAVHDVSTFGSLLLDDPDCDGLMLFLETIRDAPGLAAMAAKARALSKPVVAYQVGRSNEGQALAVGHTGAMVGGVKAREAFLKHIGIEQVETLEALIEAPPALRLRARMAARPAAVTVVTTTGGGGAMVVDQLSLRGVNVRGPSEATVAALADLSLPIGRGKLVDVTLAGARYDVMRRVIETLITDPETGLVVVAIGSSAQFRPELAVTPILDAVAAQGAEAAPVLAFPLPNAPESLRLFSEAGIPAFRTLESCAETITHLLATDVPPSDVVSEIGTAPATAISDFVDSRVTGTLDEATGSELFKLAGVTTAPSLLLVPDAHAPDTLPFPFPVVLKAVASDLAHKSEAGGVIVGVADRTALDTAIADLRRSMADQGIALSGLLVQQQMTGGLGEALIGLTRDPVVGPMVTVGAGGITTELYGDVSLRPAPVTPQTALAMIKEVKGLRLLDGFRGREKGDIARLAETVAALSHLADEPRILEAEANPVIVLHEGRGAVAVDALVVLA